MADAELDHNFGLNDELHLQDPFNSIMTDDLSSGQHFDGSQSKSETCSMVDNSPAIKQYGKSHFTSTLNRLCYSYVSKLILVGFHDGAHTFGIIKKGVIHTASDFNLTIIAEVICSVSSSSGYLVQLTPQGEDNATR